MKNLLFIFALVALAGCGNANSSDNKKTAHTISLDSINYARHHLQPGSPEYIDSLNGVKHIAVIKHNFTTVTDSFDNTTYYYHLWGKSEPTHTALYAYCNSKGKLFLVSNYMGNTWLFHTHVKVRIDTTYYTSEVVAWNNERSVMHAGICAINENVTYNSVDSIIKAIATHTNKLVMVRLIGETANHDITLDDATKQAFKETYEVAQSFVKK